jgi:hypothetical protein
VSPDFAYPCSPRGVASGFGSSACNMTQAEFMKTMVVRTTTDRVITETREDKGEMPDFEFENRKS